ncbi:MAG: hypothetical protein H6635_07450 [Anaerolineales bacterium]|nr:hypothetical protein [Anaerolineales bacterium]MCB9145186.1 hypothetical protein [Anaerolineales bacterium]
METNPVPSSAEPKNNRNVIIGVVVAVVLCCCCVVTGVGGYYGYQTYVAAQQAIEEFQDFEIPEIPTDVPFNPSDPNNPGDVPSFDYSGDVPSGGLADDETRLVAWASVQLVGMMSGCTAPNAAGTTITVLTEPSNGGPWREEWNVDCGDGTFTAIPLTFTPENGITSVTVDYQP